MQISYDKIDAVAITCDIDWAPEEVIQHTLDIFEKYKIKCTLFCTHDSEVIRNCNQDLFELAIHPNFNNLLNGNGNKESAEKIIDELLEIYPEAIGVRSHSMTQSSGLLNLFASKGLKYDANHFLPYHSGVYPYRLWNGMIKFPYIWEDDIHWWYGYDFSETCINLEGKGLKVFDFHPIHVYLNTESQDRYDQAKPYYHNFKKLEAFRNPEKGTETLLRSLCETINQGKSTQSLREITDSIY